MKILQALLMPILLLYLHLLLFICFRDSVLYILKLKSIAKEQTDQPWFLALPSLI